jgi:hypothetical protein
MFDESIEELRAGVSNIVVSPELRQLIEGQGSYTRLNTRCFPGDTPILMADGTTKPIRAIDFSDWIMALDPAQPFAGLVPRQVTRLYRNTTDTWLKLTFLDGGTLSATPGHEMLAADGRFARLDQLVSWQADGTGRVTLVGESGALRPARAETIRFSAATAHLYPLADAAALAQGHQIAPIPSATSRSRRCIAIRKDT